jgi:hypothetical protein
LVKLFQKEKIKMWKVNGWSLASMEGSL